MDASELQIAIGKRVKTINFLQKFNQTRKILKDEVDESKQKNLKNKKRSHRS